MRLGLPVFVVVQRQSKRDVHLGWVEDASDETASFLITFGTAPPTSPLHGMADEDALEFEPLVDAPRRRSEVNRRERDPRWVQSPESLRRSLCSLRIGYRWIGRRSSRDTRRRWRLQRSEKRTVALPYSLQGI